MYAALNYWKLFLKRLEIYIILFLEFVLIFVIDGWLEVSKEDRGLEILGKKEIAFIIHIQCCKRFNLLWLNYFLSEHYFNYSS